MADVNQQDSSTSGELSSKEELYSGSLELPEENKSAESELPAKVVENDQGNASQSTKSEDSDDFSFEDLINKAPEAFRPELKKVQAHYTKKNQSYSEKLKALESNQMTDEIRQVLSGTQEWWNKLQRNPKDSLKELASTIGVSVKDLVDASEAITQQPKSEELTLQQVVANPTAENWAAFQRQEARKLIEQEVNPLKQTISTFTRQAETLEYQKNGYAALEEAKSIFPGFAKEDGQLTPEGEQALLLAAKGQETGFIGPNALKNAFLAVSSASYQKRLKDLESENKTLKSGIKGAGSLPGVKSTTTTLAPVNPRDFWDEVIKEPLSDG